MDQKEIRTWESALDVAELSPITTNLPSDASVGAIFEETGSDGVRRLWRRVLIVAGNVGGRWAYWQSWEDKDSATGRTRAGIGPHPSHHVIADKIFNGDASHFVGMLGVPYAGRLGVGNVDSTAWVLVEPKMQGPRVVHVREEKPKERYEKSKEVYDLETGLTERLP